MIDVITYPERRLDQLCHPWAGPRIGGKTGGADTRKQELFEPAFGPGIRDRRASGRRLGGDSLFALRSITRFPASYTAPVHTNLSRHLDRRHIFFQQRDRVSAPTFQFLWVARRSHLIPSAAGTGCLLSREQ